MVLAATVLGALSMSSVASASCVWDGRTWLCDSFRHQYQYLDRDREHRDHWRWREHRRREERLDHEHYRE